MRTKSHVLDSIREFYPDYHPLVSIAHIAHSDEADARLKYDCHKVIAKYVEPELKSLEVKGSFTETRRVEISLFDDLARIEDGEIIEPEQQAVLVDKSVDVY